jgi:hypothetical protein
MTTSMINMRIPKYEGWSQYVQDWQLLFENGRIRFSDNVDELTNIALMECLRKELEAICKIDEEAAIQLETFFAENTVNIL